MKNSLWENQTITLVSEINIGHIRSFTILETVGQGVSCIAYKALDSASRIPVIIKECFPRSTAFREESGKVIWSITEDETRAKERFRASFETQRQIQSIDEMTNTNAHLIDGLYIGNNTLYSVSGTQNAKILSDMPPDSFLQDICKIIKAIAAAIGKYHEYGLLHLDIKPQNILIFPETREIVKLLDFDSVISKKDISAPGTSISYTHEYAAPELLQGKRIKICEATDIYSIGAVMFSRIMGKTPTADDRGAFAEWDLPENLFGKLSNKSKRLTKEILRKTIAASVSKRYKRAEDLVFALDALIEECNPYRRRLNSTFTPSRNYFTGRSSELRAIHDAYLSGKRAVFLFGMGGIGKTELALKYAEQFRDNYDIIAFGRFSDSLENLFKSSDFISIENDTEGKPRLDSIRGLVDERTLLIIDNFDVEADDKLDAVLSLKCKLLITSRHSFEDLYENDSATQHINVKELSQNEQMSLLERECGHKLSENEYDAARRILQDIGGYTLLIPLIAKTYKNDDYDLVEMSQRIHNAGVKGASEINIRHHKDSNLSGSTYAILCEVLNMANLSDEETYVMRSLALLSGILITRKEFNAWLGGKYKNTIISLAEKSWVQINGTGQYAKLSLHKVIGDMARDVLKPDFENCTWARALCDEIVEWLLGKQTIRLLGDYIEDCMDESPNSSLYIDDEQWDRLELIEDLILEQNKMMHSLFLTIVENISFFQEGDILFRIFGGSYSIRHGGSLISRDGIPISRSFYEDCSDKVKTFLKLDRKTSAAELLLAAIFGKESDKLPCETRLNMYSNFRINELYEVRLENAAFPDEFDRILFSLASDEDFTQKEKIGFLIEKVDEFGFESIDFSLLNGDIPDHEHQLKAKKCLEYLKTWADYLDSWHGSRYVTQSLMLSCCMDDYLNVDKFVDEYFRFAYKNNKLELNLTLLCKALDNFGHSKVASLFANSCMAKLEFEIQNVCEYGRVPYNLYQSAAYIASHIGIPEKVEYYERKSRESLYAEIRIVEAGRNADSEIVSFDWLWDYIYEKGMSNKLETVRLYDLYSSAIHIAKIDNIPEQEKYYKEKQIELLGLGFAFKNL